MIPDFKERDDKLKSKLLVTANERRVKKGKLPPEILIKQTGKDPDLGEDENGDKI